MTADETDAENTVSAAMAGSVFAGAAPGDNETLYDALGVSEHATVEEIKQAYYRLVRQFRPADHPETFQRFSEASRTLTDARRRGEYDQHRRSGRRVQVLMDQAAVSLERDAQKAVALLKNAIALAPDMPRPRHLLAHVLMRIEDYALAEKQYRWLLKEYPRDETVYFRIAQCQYFQKHYEAALKTLDKAFALNSCYHDAMMLKAKINEVVGAYDQAVETLERAIANDGKENYADLEALVRLLAVHYLREDAAAQEATLKRLLEVLPAGDREKATRGVQRLMLRAIELSEIGEATTMDAAMGLLDAAARFVDADPEKRDEAAALRQQFILAEEAKYLSADPLLIAPLKDCLLIKFMGRTTDAQRAARMETAVSALQSAIFAQPRQLQQSIIYVRHEYPGIAESQSALLDELMNRVTRRIDALEASGGSRELVQDTTMPVAPYENDSADKSGRKGILGIFRRRGKPDSR